MKGKATVENVIQHSKKQNVPTLLKFQNGELAVTSKATTKFCRIRNTERNTTSALVVTSGQVYHGEVGQAKADELTDLYVCVRNKNTNKVRIVPIEQAKLSNHVYNDLQTNSMVKLSEETTLMTWVKEFGGRFASRALAKRDKLKVNADILKMEVDATIEAAETLEGADDQVLNEANIDRIRPNFNKDATELADIYKVEDLVPAALLERLDDEARVVCTTPIEKLPIKSDFIRQCIVREQNQTQSAQKLLRIKLLIYMDCLSNLLTCDVRAMRKQEISGITEKVETDARFRFLDQNTKHLTRSRVCTEKALCYFIIMALLIDDKYQTDVDVLSKELHTTRRKIMMYTQILNARVTWKSNMLKLCLPSKMPALRNAFMKRHKAAQ